MELKLIAEKSFESEPRLGRINDSLDVRWLIEGRDD